MTLRAVAVSGSPRAPSKSKTLAELMLAALGHGGCETQMVDVAALPADALVARASAPAMDSAIAAIGEAQIVVAASPTYRALYTGVMKSFFDLMPHGHLAGKDLRADPDGRLAATLPHHRVRDAPALRESRWRADRRRLRD